METDGKPEVCIRTSGRVPDEVVRYIGWGLEEEGIPVSSAGESLHATAALLAKAAALASRLHVGIGIHGDSGQVALHHRDMPDDCPLFTEPFRPLVREAMVRLGQNAARLVKGNSFRMADIPAPQPRDVGEMTLCPDEVEQVAVRIVQAILAHFKER
jgi:hypothetical protein